MSNTITFNSLQGRQILDSRGDPTVEVRGELDDGTVLVTAAAGDTGSG